MTKPRTPRGRRIAARTADLARQLVEARRRYWTALLARPQLAGPIVEAIRAGIDVGSWDRRLSMLVGFGRTWIRKQLAEHRDRYQRACERAAVWLAEIDRDCGAANTCVEGILLWASRRSRDHQWCRRYGIRPAQPHWGTWRRYWAGVREARRERERLRNEIVEANEGLVITQVAKWSSWAADGHLEREDLYQEAREGLHRAADLYDPYRKPARAFSTYACHWIRHRVWRLHQEHRSDVRAPAGIQAMALKLAPLVDKHETRDPEELRAHYIEHYGPRKDPTLGAIKSALEYMGVRQVSLDQPLHHSDEGSPMTLADLLEDRGPGVDEVIDQERLRASLMTALGALPPQERSLVEDRYGLDGPAKGVSDLAKIRGVPRVEIEDRLGAVLQSLRLHLEGVTA